MEASKEGSGYALFQEFLNQKKTFLKLLKQPLNPQHHDAKCQLLN